MGELDKDPETVIFDLFAKAPIEVLVAPKYRHALAFFDRFMSRTDRDRFIAELTGPALQWQPSADEDEAGVSASQAQT